MSSDVVLSSALRTNLLSLQNTQSLIDKTQLRLATGLKVNSALDNPSNFFAAQGLQNRASDLSRLLDGIGQSIQSIKTADEGIQSLTTLIEQAESLATQAKDATSSAAESAKVIGDVDLTGYTVASGQNGDSLVFSIVDQDGETLALTDANGDGAGQIDLATNDTIETIVNKINAFKTAVGNNQVFNAELTDDGRLSIATVNGYSFNLNIDGGSSVADSTSTAALLGFGDLVQDTKSTFDAAGTANNTDVGFTARAAAIATTQSLYTATGTPTGTNLATRSTTLDGLFRDKDGNGTIAASEEAFALNNFSADGSTDSLQLNVGINGGASRAITGLDGTTTIQQLVDKINADSVLKTKVEASFNEETGQIALASLDSTVESIELSVTLTDVDANNGGDADTDADVVFDLGFGVISAQANGGELTTSTAAGETESAQSDIESIRLSGGAGDLAQFQSDYNKTLEQIDSLVNDTSYRGVNLLKGDTLETTFNEDGTSALTTSGKDLTSAGLGLTSASFINGSTIQESVDQAKAALTTVRNFSSSLASDLSVIQTREEFTKNLINNLQEGSDKLTLADQNEEGAKLLALQTRQTLGVTSLSLASQSQQSVLRLF